jgi:hypothetical protein
MRRSYACSRLSRYGYAYAYVCGFVASNREPAGRTHTHVLTHLPAGHRASAGCRQAAGAPAQGHPHCSAWWRPRRIRHPYCCGRVGSSLRPPRGRSCSRARCRHAVQAEALPSQAVVAARARLARASRDAHGGRARWVARWGPGMAAPVHGCRLDTAVMRGVAGWIRVETCCIYSRNDNADCRYTQDGST